MRNEYISGTSSAETPPSTPALLQAALSMVRTYLPSSWKVQARPERAGTGPLWEIQGPDATVARLPVTVARRIEPKGIAPLLQQAVQTDAQAHPFVISTFLSPRTRALLEAAEANYLDSTGNIYLHLEQPAVFIQRVGALTDPWHVARPVLSLKGPAAARVVRALCDFRPPYGILELAARAQTPASSVSRIVDLLDREAVLRRVPRGAILEVHVADLIRRWTKDYGLARSHTVTALLEPRGLDALLKKLKDVPWSYAVTGSLAAKTVAPYAAARLGVLYMAQSLQAQAHLGLRPVETGANVLLVEPFDSVVFDRTTVRDGVRYAALAQVAADLLTSPGRGPAEGEELLRWMEAHTDDWQQ